jgi:NAD(P)H-hydrate epimerase
VVRRVQPDILARVPLRGAGDTKYSAGTVAIVGGAPGMTGAAVLAARAALRADAGYAVLCVPQDSLAVAETLALEPVKVGFAADEALARVVAATARAGAVAVGPGLGRDAGTRDLVRGLLERVAVPVVVDADGLFGLEPVERPHPTILTPHAGELARLLGVDADWVQAHRLEAARRAASGFGAVVVLKGPDTIVSAPDGTTLVSDLGPAALATAGTGDVLTGIVAAFLAKGLDATHAAAAAVVAHSLAARRTDRGSGLIASDLVDALSGVLCERPEPL